MKNLSYKLTKFACYSANLTMVSVFCVPSLLFVTFRELYGISYTLLGTLVLINFCTQLGIDLIFTFFSKHFNHKLCLRLMPIITSVGMLIYTLIPTFFPSYAYIGLAVGTVIFSVSAGLAEVLLSPVIAAIPSDNPQRDMSLLHSLYGFGVVLMALISSLFFLIFGAEKWNYLMFILALLPLVSALLLAISPMPDVTAGETVEKNGGAKKRVLGLALCVACIFFGGSAEVTMTNWVSGFIETTFTINKALGDVIGVAGFALLLALARMIYAKFGKKIMPTLLVGMIGAAICYLTVGLSSNPVVSLIACVLTGLFTSMLWPGTLIMMEENVKGVGVAAFALMAAGGDMGAAFAPQLLGAVTDTVAASTLGVRLAEVLDITAAQAGMRVGMIVCALFPIVGIVIVITAMRYFKKTKLENE